MTQVLLDTLLTDIAESWGVPLSNLVALFHACERRSPATYETVSESEARGLQIKAPAFRITAGRRGPRLLFLDSCTRLNDRTQLIPRLVPERRQQQLQCENGLTAASMHPTHGRLPEQLFSPLRERPLPVDRADRPVRDR